MTRPWTIGAAIGATLTAGVLAATPLSAQGKHFNDPYSIMAPEPGVAPVYRSPRGLPQKPNSTRTQPLLPHDSVRVVPSPPPTVLPNGQLIHNLPPPRQGIVPSGGTETFGDRALRCAHQSGLYGVPAGQQGAYIQSCVQ
jgi:hypothetical protein